MMTMPLDVSRRRHRRERRDRDDARLRLLDRRDLAVRARRGARLDRLVPHEPVAARRDHDRARVRSRGSSGPSRLSRGVTVEPRVRPSPIETVGCRACPDTASASTRRSRRPRRSPISRRSTTSATGIRASRRRRRLDEGELRLGSTFEVVVRVGRRELPLRYEVVRFEQGELIALEATARWFRSYDVITVTAKGDGLGRELRRAARAEEPREARRAAHGTGLQEDRRRRGGGAAAGAGVSAGCSRRARPRTSP